MNPAKPTKDLKTQGTYRKDRHANRVEGVLKPVGSIPDAPKYFDKKHQEKWAEVCKNLFELTLLKSVDFDLIEKYVQNWFISQEAWQQIAKEGLTIETARGAVKNPAINVMNEAQKVVIQIGSLFAFNPQARMRIKTEEQKPVDPFEQFLTNN